MTGDDQLSGRTKKKCQSTFESQTCTKKGSRSLFGGLLLPCSAAALIHCCFLNLDETITSEKYAQQIDGMH